MSEFSPDAPTDWYDDAQLNCIIKEDILFHLRFDIPQLFVPDKLGSEAIEMRDLDDEIMKFPSIDVVPKRNGTWNTGLGCVWCSECRYETDGFDNRYHFCPNCGARMNY